MVYAYIFVKTQTGSSTELVDRIRGLDLVAEAHVVAGEFDIIVEVETTEVHEVLQTAASEIQSLSGVADTKTYISLGD